VLYRRPRPAHAPQFFVPLYILSRPSRQRPEGVVKTVHIFPSIIIVLSIAAAIICAWQGDYRKAAYWFFAACLNGSVVVM
jgi:hypothetical protein